MLLAPLFFFFFVKKQVLGKALKGVLYYAVVYGCIIRWLINLICLIQFDKQETNGCRFLNEGPT